MTFDLDVISKLCAVAGMGLLLWPTIQRLRGGAPAAQASGWMQLKSPLWWAGLVLICLALMFQRLAAQQMGG